MAGWEPMLEEVARERYPRLVARALLLTRSRAEAEDLVQEALVATFGGRARFASAPQAEQYVRRAIVSRFVDGTRRAGRERAAVTALGQAALSSSAGRDEPGLPGLSGPVEAALGLLSPRQRACVVLRHLEDLSVRETAQLLGLSEGTVKRYVAEGVATMSRVLGATATPEHSPVLLIDEEARHDA